MQKNYNNKKLHKTLSRDTESIMMQIRQYLKRISPPRKSSQSRARISKLLRSNILLSDDKYVWKTDQQSLQARQKMETIYSKSNETKSKKWEIINDFVFKVHYTHSLN